MAATSTEKKGRGRPRSKAAPLPPSEPPRQGKHIGPIRLHLNEVQARIVLNAMTLSMSTREYTTNEEEREAEKTKDELVELIAQAGWRM